MANPDERNNTRKYLKYAVRAATAAEKPRAKSGRMFRRNTATVRTEPDSPHRTAGRRDIGSFAPIGPLPGRMSSRLAVAIRACDPHRTGKDAAGRYPVPPTTACLQPLPFGPFAASHTGDPNRSESLLGTDPYRPVRNRKSPCRRSKLPAARTGTVATRRPCTATGPSSPIPSTPTASAASAASRPFRPGRHKKSPNLSPGSFRLRCF